MLDFPRRVLLPLFDKQPASVTDNDDEQGTKSTALGSSRNHTTMTSHFPLARSTTASQAYHRDPRRQPFSNAANHQMPIPISKPASPSKPALASVQQKAPSPPLPKQNTKVPPPSPPQVIRDAERAISYKRVGFLGEVCLKSKRYILHAQLMNREDLLECTKRRTSGEIELQSRS